MTQKYQNNSEDLQWDVGVRRMKAAVGVAQSVR